MQNVDALRQALVHKRKRELDKLSPLPKTPVDIVRTGIPEISTRTFSNELVRMFFSNLTPWYNL